MSDIQTTELIVSHAAGLHMRPATLFVQTAARFQSSIKLTNLDRANSTSADAKSMFNVMMLGVKQGNRILVEASGADAAEALAALSALVARDFEGQA